MKKSFLAVTSMAVAGWVFPCAAGGSPLTRQIAAQLNAFTLMLPANEEMNREYLAVSDWGKNDDSIIFKLFTTALLPDARVMQLADSQKPDGSWPDINYADAKLTQWEPYSHCVRIYAMTKACKTKGSKLHGSPKVSAAIHKALDFWFRADLKCPNWWQNEIGVGRMLGPVLLLLRDELSKEEFDAGIRMLDVTKFTRTGQNKVWQAANICVKGLLLDDEALVRRARDVIFSELRGADGEGVQPDWSFHQHGPMMQFGNYGMSFAIVQSEWAEIFRDTPLALDKQREEFLTDYITKGLQWTIWRGYMDINALGRQLASNIQRGRAYSLALGIGHLMTIRPGDPGLKAFLERNIINPRMPNDLTGFKFFPRSDYAVMRAASWFASARMHSARTIGFEMTAGDNRQGAYCADGTLLLMRDGKEYENITPIWDWKRLPGVTVADDGKPLPYRHSKTPLNKSEFVGGLQSGNGGVAAMELIYDGRHEHKAYFFDEDGVLALGAGIKIDGAFRTTTGIEQNNLRGDVYYSAAGKISKLEKDSETTIKNPEWLWHDNTGYLLLQPADVVISNKVQSGNWRDISQNDKNENVSREVFKACIDHGVQPLNGSCAYFIAPGVKPGQLDEMSARLAGVVLANNAGMQAVLRNKVVRAVFHKPGTLTLPDKSTVSTSEAIILEIDTIKNEMRATDPKQKLDAVDVTTTTTATTTITITTASATTAAGTQQGFSSRLNETDVKAVANAVAGWHMKEFHNIDKERKWKQSEVSWANAVFVNALAAWSDFAGTKAQAKWVEDLARRNYYSPAPLMYKADDIFICFTYATLYDKHRDFKYIAPTVARLDFQVNHPSTGSLIFGEPGCIDRWAWCDTLYLGPATFFRFAKYVNDERYITHADKEFWNTYDTLYDKDERLFYRDTRYKPQREANGEKIFWGRGNGWVVGGLAQLLDHLPPSHPNYPRYVALYKDMMARLITLQDKDGYWHSSLLDPAAYPHPETSATAMIGHALWWGINKGILDKKTFLPHAEKCWAALVKAVRPDGMLGWMQAIGADPKAITAGMTEAYGAGAMIMTAQQILIYLNH